MFTGAKTLWLQPIFKFKEGEILGLLTPIKWM